MAQNGCQSTYFQMYRPYIISFCTSPNSKYMWKYFGNEGHGISRLVRENCDQIIAIPQYGKINSLNASVAAAVLIYGIVNR